MHVYITKHTRLNELAVHMLIIVIPCLVLMYISSQQYQCTAHGIVLKEAGMLIRQTKLQEGQNSHVYSVHLYPQFTVLHNFFHVLITCTVSLPYIM